MKRSYKSIAIVASAALSLGAFTGCHSDEASKMKISSKSNALTAIENPYIFDRLSAGSPPATVGSWLSPGPGVFPFRVQSVGYDLWHYENGTAEVAHTVKVWKQNTATPPSNPNIIHTIYVPASSGKTKGTYTFTHSLPSPVTLYRGERLFVSITVPFDGDGKSLCVASCNKTEGIEHDFWADEEWPTYTWYELNDFGLDENLRIWAYGEEPFNPAP